MDLNIKSLPQECESWTHHKGEEYIVICTTNTCALDHEKFPVTVVYQGKDGRLWSRPANSFLRKFNRSSTNKA